MPSNAGSNSSSISYASAELPPGVLIVDAACLIIELSSPQSMREGGM
jgi:hypothetical protein